MLGIVIVAILVGFLGFIAKWICSKKAGEKFSLGYVLSVLGLGALSLTVLTLFAVLVWDGRFTGLTNPYASGILTALISAAIYEELAKYAAFRIAALNKKQMSTWFDSVLVAILVAIGFSMLEDFFYGIDGNPATLIRMALPCHIIFGTAMGYFYGKARVTNDAKYHVLSLVAPILLHFTFDVAPIVCGVVTKDVDYTNLSSDSPLYIGICVSAILTCIALIAFLVLTIKTFKGIARCSANNELQDELYAEAPEHMVNVVIQNQ